MIVDIIKDRIDAAPDRKITFREFMELALYHPEGGYYSSGKVNIGKEGDFFTSSSLGSDLGELLAEQFIEMGEKLGGNLTLVEAGAGTGVLAADILNYLENRYGEVYLDLTYIIVERSPALISRQKETLNKYHDKIVWRTWEEIAAGSITGCIFSNELIDAFPVHLLQKEGGRLKEVYLEEGLRETIGELSTGRINDYFELVGIDINAPEYPEGYRTEVNLAALDWLTIVSDKLSRGYILTIDYGYPASKYYHPRRFGGTLQCYYQHRHHNDPYVNIGLQDLTAHVDFTALERYGERLGLINLGFTKQGLFLMSLGLGHRLTALSSGGHDALTVMRRRDALHRLIDPNGLGGFSVSIQAKGVDGILQGLSNEASSALF